MTVKLVSCSKCGSVVPSNKTVVIEHKRVCHMCKKEASKSSRNVRI